jgi:hypothetical protein
MKEFFYDPTNVGLILDIIGVGLLFFYKGPSKELTNVNALIYKDPDPKITASIKRAGKVAFCGLILIIIGSIFQLIGNNL